MSRACGGCLGGGQIAQPVALPEVRLPARWIFPSDVHPPRGDSQTVAIRYPPPLRKGQREVSPKGPHPTLGSRTAKSPGMAVTGMSAKEGSQFYEAGIATKSMHRISTAPCHRGSSLSDPTKTLTPPEQIITSQPIV